MPNRVLYLAATPDEVHQCAYSLLKYLEVYNLKPPAENSLVIYTNDPASLELYGSFFSHFELREAGVSTVDAILRSAAAGFDGNLLYMACNAYPVRPLEPLFNAIQSGTVFSAQSFNEKTRSKDIRVMGWNSGALATPPGTEGRELDNFIAQYSNIREFNSFLQYFFRRYQEESVPNQVKLIHNVDALSIQQKRDAFKQLPFYVRWIRKALGKGWSISAHTQRV